jgi:hypothetical protein
VVCLFGIVLNDIDEFPQPAVIERLQTAFPDCLVRAGNRRLRVEFELYGSNFNHPCDECDVLVCWRDDRHDWPEKLLVVELADVVAAKRPDLYVHFEEHYPAPWNADTFFAAAERNGTDGVDVALARRVIELAEQYRFGPVWLVCPRAVFAVGSPQFFKVAATGRISFPFSRLKAGAAFGDLVERLNRVVPRLQLTVADANSKSRGGQLSALFESDPQLREFFDVWAWFRNAGRAANDRPRSNV